LPADRPSATAPAPSAFLAEGHPDCRRPGCGKSLTAKAVAEQWRLPLLKARYGPTVRWEWSAPLKKTCARRFTYRRVDSPQRCCGSTRFGKRLARCSAAQHEGGGKRRGTTARVIRDLPDSGCRKRQLPIFSSATANDIRRAASRALLRKGASTRSSVRRFCPPTPKRKTIFTIHISRRIGSGRLRSGPIGRRDAAATPGRRSSGGDRGMFHAFAAVRSSPPRISSAPARSPSAVRAHGGEDRRLRSGRGLRTRSASSEEINRGQVARSEASPSGCKRNHRNN